MGNTSSESLHQAIQHALSGGDFDSVRELSVALGQAIIREAQAVAPAERSAVAEKSLGLLREHLSMARVLRAHVASHLQENTAVSLYQQPAGRGHCWGFDA
jgi:hypothetical protein